MASNPHPLHGVTLEQIVTRLSDYYGWEELGRRINIRCFQDNPSVGSSLKFLRKTPWARTKVEELYLYMLRKHRLEFED
ncbi:hypothetical protein DKM44_00695 [Deinococcus irradiatisoli]|uniref:Transporter n=1 Tax=Deinococcus irradiatisoli TaxID=2202254 RepID=A0A2Z3JT40_9DEIO|nr:VF530 family protein [Deinococcus irradiatisoli]AWN24388.1 hypothetical protein DKM44_00695 [Deinococcus irradiatisoli]